ncbi:lysophospholipase [Xylaria nigripes]|nr:lysophospholipase [Xylaria nigripes]
MHIVPSALQLSLLSSVPAAFAVPSEFVPRHGQAQGLSRRAVPDSPSGGYAPALVDCPSPAPTIRDASSLSSSETKWLQKRRPNTIQPMIDFMKVTNISGFDAAGYIQSNAKDISNVPNIGIAISGGSYRAMLNGAGFLAAADARTPGSTEPGGIGNLLQASTYISGSSGGGWLVGSMYANNFSSVVSMRDASPSSPLWKLTANIFEGVSQIGLSMTEYWDRIFDEVNQKRDAGFEISFTDLWGRALSFQLINDANGGPAYTMSSIADDPSFAAGEIPMPFIMADELQLGGNFPSPTASVFEMGPFEFGTWDPTVSGFAPIKYLGTSFAHGAVPKKGKCVQGYDQLGYIIGTTSELFNEQPITDFVESVLLTPLSPDIIKTIETVLNGTDGFVSKVPNPFYKYNPSTNEYTHEDVLPLIDGGENGEDIPVEPMIQPLRHVDVIFAVDSGADITFNYPNGNDMRATFQRSTTDFKKHAQGPQFPAIPDANTFINLGLNQKPTFFGCDTSEFTRGSQPPPLVVYIPLAPYSAFSNSSTTTLVFSDEERDAFIQNGYNMGTMGNGTIEADWPACAACAVLSRSFERTGTPVPATCQSCFNLHCYNGTTDTTPATYDPTLILTPTTPTPTAAA